jgi:hypothetical protein
MHELCVHILKCIFNRCSVTGNSVVTRFLKYFLSHWNEVKSDSINTGKIRGTDSLLNGYNFKKSVVHNVRFIYKIFTQHISIWVLIHDHCRYRYPLEGGTAAEETKGTVESYRCLVLFHAFEHVTFRSCRFNTCFTLFDEKDRPSDGVLLSASNHQN